MENPRFMEFLKSPLMARQVQKHPPLTGHIEAQFQVPTVSQKGKEQSHARESCEAPKENLSVHKQAFEGSILQNPIVHEVSEDSSQPEETFRMQLVNDVTLFKHLMENPRFMEFLKSPLMARQVQKHPPLTGHIEAQFQVPTVSQKGKEQSHARESCEAPKENLSFHKQVVKRPVLQAIPLQPVTLVCPNVGFYGQKTMLQAMDQVLPPSIAHSENFAGGSVFQSMTGYALENQQYMPGTMFGGIMDDEVVIVVCVIAILMSAIKALELADFDGQDVQKYTHQLGQRCASSALGNYCLLGDCAYPARFWMLPPFKGSKDGLSLKQYFWNYELSSLRMPVERAFGMLKVRFRILLKRCDMLLQNVPKMIRICLVLHMYIVHADAFDEVWIRQAQGELRRAQAEETVSNPDPIVCSGLTAALAEVTSLIESDPSQVAERTKIMENVSFDATNISEAQRRDNLARVMFNERARRSVNLIFGDNDSADESFDSD
ncbi:hypothetical protein L7F22_059417 [Adiantum nelumboides]|nr:hypothetical protein [Adiantum nelumboides]